MVCVTDTHSRSTIGDFFTFCSRCFCCYVEPPLHPRADRGRCCGHGCRVAGRRPRDGVRALRATVVRRVPRRPRRRDRRVPIEAWCRVAVHRNTRLHGESETDDELATSTLCHRREEAFESIAPTSRCPGSRNNAVRLEGHTEARDSHREESGAGGEEEDGHPPSCASDLRLCHREWLACQGRSRRISRI